MAVERASKPVALCLRCLRNDLPTVSKRTFQSTAAPRLDAEVRQDATSGAPPPDMPVSSTKKGLDPFNVVSARAERRLLRETRQVPVGSRRRRAAMAATTSIPFTELPYQCFQEARKYLQEDRAEKLEAVRVQRERIARLNATEVPPQDEARKEKRLVDMRYRLEKLKIWADINDPVVKKTFEDGRGDMNKPIYRFLADKKWRSYKRKVLVQRIEQMNVIPDVLPALDPVVSTDLYFAAKKISHGDFVESYRSERAPNLNIQCFDKGPRLVTIAVINSDVPEVAKDGFNYRCHFLASNIRISPTEARVDLRNLDESSQIILPWLPAYAQKGLPYQRMSIVIMQQPESDVGGSQELDVAAIKEAGRYTKREGFLLRSFNYKHSLKPVGADLFRTQWDEGTAGVMHRAGIVGADLEFKRKRVEPLPYQRKSTERYR